MRWTVGTKISLGFMLALAILIGVGAVSHQSTTKLTETADMVTHTHKVIERLAALLQALTDAETGQRGFVITGEDSYLEPYRAGSATVEKYVKDLKNLVSDNPRQLQRLDVLHAQVEKRLESLTEVLDAQKSKGAAGAEAARQLILTGGGKKEMDDIRKIMAEMKDNELALLKDRSDEAQASARNTKLTILWGTIGAAVAFLAVAFVLSRNISTPLKQITLTAEHIAAGDLSTPIVATRRQDEVGVLSETFGRMIRSLREMAGIAEQIADGDLRVTVKPQSDRDTLGNAFSSMVKNLRNLSAQIAEGVNVLSSSANQISTSTTQFAAGAAETATAVSQTTTTVEEVRQTAQLSNQKAKLVSDAAQKTAQISQSGSKSTEESAAGMNGIRQQMELIAQSMVRLSEQTQTIGSIVSTVEDLAAQSNILAVNASIEAAKAGEQGKGFAVVAQEVRSLAEQSKQATNQVRSILTDIQKATSAAVMATEQGTKAVEFGVVRSNQAGQSIQALSNSVNEAAQVATQIAASSQQQLIGVDQVASAMESIKLASTQNVASAKQLEAAAYNLKDLGDKLKQNVEKYRL